jgi:ABC-2 type transport system ATP-binding protein
MEAVGTGGLPALELRSVSKIYGRGAKAKRAVSDVSLSVNRGEVYGFLGPNGAGKSTTIRMALGLIRPSGGEVRLFGRHVAERDALRPVGSLVDGGAFYPFLTGRENLRVLARTHGADDTPIDALLERVELRADANRKVKGYSLGMKQRLGVAAALLSNPELVIFDEPTNGLDAAGIQDMRTLIRNLADEGKAVFLSSHLLHEVEQLCDRVAIVAKGRLLREASVSAILEEGEDLWVEAEPIDLAARELQPDWLVTRTEGGIRVKARRDDAPEIAKRLVKAGIAIFHLGPHEQSLENIFLSMTQDHDA